MSVLVALLLAAARAQAQPASFPPSSLPLLDVPFVSQSEALCGGAAAAMVLRYWGERGVSADTFAPLIDRSAAGIRTTTLVDDLRRRGWVVSVTDGRPETVARELAERSAAHRSDRRSPWHLSLRRDRRRHRTGGHLPRSGPSAAAGHGPRRIRSAFARCWSMDGGRASGDASGRRSFCAGLA